MKQLKTIDKNFSTTRLCYKLLPEDYLDESGRVKEELKFKINLPELGIVDSKIPRQGDEKFDTYLFLPPGEGRQGEGGLRTRGYFKFSYEIENGRWFACDFRGKRLFEVEPPEELDIDLEQFKSDDGIIRLPLITVITVVLNGEKYLEETIRSVINQTYPNVEYIMIDGCSTDGTLDIIRKYEDCIDYWVSEKDSGISDAFNKGIKLSSGLWIGILNSDDWYESNVFTIVVIKLLKNNGDVIYGKCNYWICDKIQYISDANHFYLTKFMSLNHPASFVRKTSYLKYGLFDNAYKFAMDYDLYLRFYLKGLNFYYLDYVIANMRLDGKSDKNWILAYWESFKIKNNLIKKRTMHFSFFVFLVSKGLLRRIFEHCGFNFIVKFYRQKVAKLKKYSIFK